MRTRNSREDELLVWLNSRNIALALYGAMGFEVGLATLLTGGPVALEVNFGIWIRIIVGLLALIGGILTVAGAICGRSKAGWVVTIVGTTLLAAWVGFVDTGYFLSTLDGGVTFAMPWHAVPHSYARLYIPVFYQSVLMLILLHVVTLMRIGPPRPR